MVFDRQRRNVALLVTSQALFMTVQSTMIILSGLVGLAISPEKALATLPVSTTVIATAMTTIPASLYMKRVGRRRGFMLGAGLGVLGAVLASYAIWIAHFWLFCASTALLGVAAGFAQFYRFAAADVATPAFRPRAISLVVAGGVVAAFIGPTIVRTTNEWFAPFLFMGSTVTLVGVGIVAFFVLAFLDIPKLSQQDIDDPGRPLFEIMRQPVFVVAVLAGMVGYATMSLIMTATPIAMVGCGFAVGDAATAIQWHVVAMFLPSLFTGNLIARVGVLPVILTGMALLAGCVAVALMGIEIENFMIALIALGLGWNFAFVGASALVTETYRPAERAKTQAANDFLVFGSVAIASLSSGAVVHYLGWEYVQYLALPFVAVATLSTTWLYVVRRRAARVGTA